MGRLPLRRVHLSFCFVCKFNVTPITVLAGSVSVFPGADVCCPGAGPNGMSTEGGHVGGGGEVAGGAEFAGGGVVKRKLIRDEKIRERNEREERAEARANDILHTLACENGELSMVGLVKSMKLDAHRQVSPA